MENMQVKSTNAFKKNRERYFFLCLVIYCCLAALLLFMAHRIFSRATLDAIKREAEHNLDIQQKTLTRHFNTVLGDINFLAVQNELKIFLGNGDKRDRSLIEKEYIAFCLNRKLYDQIRYIDETGNEICRVNYKGGKPQKVPDNLLQSKKGRYYFKGTIKLGRGEVFISLLDLNVENGEIEQPLKPMIRFAVQVYDDRGKKRGIIVLNHFGTKIINNIQDVARLSPGEVMLLNSDGYWLKGLKPEDEWGFMISSRSRRKFQNDYPATWNEIKNSERTQIVSKDGFFASRTINPLDEAGFDIESPKLKNKIPGYIKDWKLVYFLSRDRIEVQKRELESMLKGTGIILMMLGVVGSYFVANELARRKRHKQALLMKANFDRLTGLPNRTMFLEELFSIRDQASQSGGVFALFFMDLDGFKAVNDTFGHHVGDKLLDCFGKRLVHNVRKSDIVARLGGDEFTIILPQITCEKNAGRVAQKIINSMSQPFIIDNKDIQIGVSIGIALYSNKEDTPESLLQKADSAMYDAKKAGKNTFRFFR